MFGNVRGAENEAAFMNVLKVIEMRGRTLSERAFKNQANMVQRAISAMRGRVGADE
ncbi:hypothetical protein J8I87_35675 [Paraburkholderia sp. LEh10]|uniref:hypothetical protein n=1 Tax=Paraburkholderia sp. LEh10 TaxID=2821353 RepID=UPI001AE97917|nr:hypothetical protein [Paraburkholderia sp. LEh10]MBP0594912.1 hypothetical protein [Paraburkholderia sp. LEh10]